MNREDYRKLSRSYDKEGFILLGLIALCNVPLFFFAPAIGYSLSLFWFVGLICHFVWKEEYIGKKPNQTERRMMLERKLKGL